MKKSTKVMSGFLGLLVVVGVVVGILYAVGVLGKKNTAKPLPIIPGQPLVPGSAHGITMPEAIITFSAINPEEVIVTFSTVNVPADPDYSTAMTLHKNDEIPVGIYGKPDVPQSFSYTLNQGDTINATLQVVLPDNNIIASTTKTYTRK